MDYLQRPINYFFNTPHQKYLQKLRHDKEVSSLGIANLALHMLALGFRPTVACRRLPLREATDVPAFLTGGRTRTVPRTDLGIVGQKWPLVGCLIRFWIGWDAGRTSKQSEILHLPVSVITLIQNYYTLHIDPLLLFFNFILILKSAKVYLWSGLSQILPVLFLGSWLAAIICCTIVCAVNNAYSYALVWHVQYLISSVECTYIQYICGNLMSALRIAP